MHILAMNSITILTLGFFFSWDMEICHLAYLTTLILHSIRYRVRTLIGDDPMTNLNHHDTFSQEKVKVNVCYYSL